MLPEGIEPESPYGTQKKCRPYKPTFICFGKFIHIFTNGIYVTVPTRIRPQILRMVHLENIIWKTWKKAIVIIYISVRNKQNVQNFICLLQYVLLWEAYNLKKNIFPCFSFFNLWKVVPHKYHKICVEI